MTHHSGDAVDARLLGGFWLLRSGRDIAPQQLSRASSLLQFLILNRRNVVPSARLTSALWFDRKLPPETSALRVAVHELRKTLKGELTISYVKGGYRVGPEITTVDVDELKKCLANGESAHRSGDRDAAKAHFQAAVRRYTGDLLPGEEAPWAQEARQWYRNRILTAIAWLRDDAAVNRRATDTLHWATQLLSLDPWDENSYQSLMMVHHRRGERGQVRNWYKLCEGELSKLGVAPQPETKKLFRQLMESH